MIHAMVCSLVFTSGAGTSSSGPMKSTISRRVAARDALQFAVRKQVGIADHAALGAAERDVDHRALPRHPRSQRAHFVERHVGRVANAALARAARDRMLHAIAGEHFEPPVVELHRNVDGDLARRRAQHFLHAVVEAQTARRLRRTAPRRPASGLNSTPSSVGTIARGIDSATAMGKSSAPIMKQRRPWEPTWPWQCAAACGRTGIAAHIHARIIRVWDPTWDAR